MSKLCTQPDFSYIWWKHQKKKVLVNVNVVANVLTSTTILAFGIGWKITDL